MAAERYEALKREILRIRKNADKGHRLSTFEIGAEVADLILNGLPVSLLSDVPM